MTYKSEEIEFDQLIIILSLTSPNQIKEDKIKFNLIMAPKSVTLINLCSMGLVRINKQPNQKLIHHIGQVSEIGGRDMSLTHHRLNLCE